MEVTGRDQTALEAATEHRVGAVKAVHRWPWRVLQGHCERCVRECVSVQAAWQVVAAEDCRLDGQRCYSEQPCAVQRDCVGLLPFSSRRVGSARWPPCVPGARGTAARVCGRPAADMCKVLVAAEAGSVRKDGKTALAPAAVADARDAALVLAACEKEAGQRDTNGFTALMGAVQHRGTDPPASLGEAASREAPQQHIADPRRAALARCCAPMKKSCN